MKNSFGKTIQFSSNNKIIGSKTNSQYTNSGFSLKQNNKQQRFLKKNIPILRNSLKRYIPWKVRKLNTFRFLKNKTNVFLNLKAANFFYMNKKRRFYMFRLKAFRRFNKMFFFFKILIKKHKLKFFFIKGFKQRNFLSSIISRINPFNTFYNIFFKNKVFFSKRKLVLKKKLSKKNVFRLFFRNKKFYLVNYVKLSPWLKKRLRIFKDIRNLKKRHKVFKRSFFFFEKSRLSRFFVNQRNFFFIFKGRHRRKKFIRFIRLFHKRRYLFKKFRKVISKKRSLSLFSFFNKKNNLNRRYFVKFSKFFFKKFFFEIKRPKLKTQKRYRIFLHIDRKLLKRYSFFKKRAFFSKKKKKKMRKFNFFFKFLNLILKKLPLKFFNFFIFSKTLKKLSFSKNFIKRFRRLKRTLKSRFRSRDTRSLQKLFYKRVQNNSFFFFNVRKEKLFYIKNKTFRARILSLLDFSLKKKLIKLFFFREKSLVAREKKKTAMLPFYKIQNFLRKKPKRLFQSDDYSFFAKTGFLRSSKFLQQRSFLFSRFFYFPAKLIYILLSKFFAKKKNLRNFLFKYSKNLIFNLFYKNKYMSYKFRFPKILVSSRVVFFLKKLYKDFQKRFVVFPSFKKKLMPSLLMSSKKTFFFLNLLVVLLKELQKNIKVGKKLNKDIKMKGKLN